MMLEAVWFKSGKEIYWVAPVENILCDEDMKDISEIEINNGYRWYTYEDIGEDADDFVIRVKREAYDER